MKLSIIIPVYNEEKTIHKVLHRVHKVPLPVRREVIVIDDASYDTTSMKLKRLKKTKYPALRIVRHDTNKGKGAAVRTGLHYAKGEILLIQDADLEYDPSYYRKLLYPILHENHQVVYGTRLKELPFILFGRNKTPLPLHYVSNKVLSLLTNILYNSNLTDMETGYKVFLRAVIEDLELTSNGFDIEPEITAKILKKGVTIHEVPIKTKPRGYDEGKKIQWIDGVHAIKTLIKHRIRK